MDIDKIKGLVKKLKYRLLNKGLENIISELRTEIKGLSYGVFDELRDILTDICNIIEDINIFDITIYKTVLKKTMTIGTTQSI